MKALIATRQPSPSGPTKTMAPIVQTAASAPKIARSLRELTYFISIVAMVLFCCSRFICTWLLKYFKPGRMMGLFAECAASLLLIVMFAGGRIGLYALVGVSAFMSLMFPTIYGLALDKVGEDAELGSAGLIMAILGGSLLPPVQALIIDGGHVELSFVVPLVCFLVVLVYGYRCSRT